jgi:hypothetical protein
MVSEPPKVFISYNRADRDWAEWIAGVIDHNGYRPINQAWDFRRDPNHFAVTVRMAPINKKESSALDGAGIPGSSIAKMLSNACRLWATPKFSPHILEREGQQDSKIFVSITPSS